MRACFDGHGKHSSSHPQAKPVERAFGAAREEIGRSRMRRWSFCSSRGRFCAGTSVTFLRMQFAGQEGEARIYRRGFLGAEGLMILGVWLMLVGAMVG